MSPGGTRDPEINKLFRVVMKHGGTDLLLEADKPPMIRLRGVVREIEMVALRAEDVDELLRPLLWDDQWQGLKQTGEVTFEHAVYGGGRFLIRVSEQEGRRSVAARHV